MLGSMHGLVVCGFAGMVLLIFRPLGWSLRFALLTILTGPIGALVVFERVRREEPAIHAREQAALTARAAGARTPRRPVGRPLTPPARRPSYDGRP